MIVAEQDKQSTDEQHVRYIQTRRPICPKCNKPTHVNNDAGEVIYWRCPHCHWTDKTRVREV